MTSDTSTSQKRRIMIITADESIIEQLQNTNHISMLRSIILDSNGDNVQVTPVNVPEKPAEVHSSPPKKRKTDSLTCVVCGSAAHGYNFDAISCESCKAFFRRNALREPKSLECRRDRNCDVTVESRRRCPACRLTKCLANGMKRDRLLTAEQKAVKLRKIEENRTLTSKANITTDQDHSNLKLETTEENPRTSTISSEKSTDLPKQSQIGLSSEELQRVETIQLSFEQRIELAAQEGLFWNPSVYGFTLVQHLNSRSVSAMRLLSFFKQIPEFNQLAVHDRVSLVKYNLSPLALLSATLSFNPESQTVVEAVHDAPLNSAIVLQTHGQEIFLQIKKIFDTFLRIAQDDQRTIQLALIVLLLTTNFAVDDMSPETILHDSLAIYRAQNCYTELLWKYLEATHGWRKATRIFNELVAHFISWQTLQGHLQQKLLRSLSPTDRGEILPLMKSLLHVV